MVEWGRGHTAGEGRALAPDLVHQAPFPPSLSLPSNLCLAPLSTGGKGYGQARGEDDFAPFRAWLQCYGMVGMRSLRDWHGRTIWFQVWVLMLIEVNRNPKEADVAET